MLSALDRLLVRPTCGKTCRGSLPPMAMRFFVGVLAATGIASVVMLARLPASGEDWATFAAVGGAAAVAQLFMVRAPNNQAYHLSMPFVVLAVLLLPLAFVPLVALVQHLPEWFKVRHPWFMQTFNAANYTLAMTAAWFAAQGVEAVAPPAYELRVALSGMAAVVVLVVVNHATLALMLRLAHGYTIASTRLLSTGPVATDVALGSLGVALVVFWQTNPLLIAFALAPLLLGHRSLALVSVADEARRDPKTGLLNARHFGRTLEVEVTRAQRTGSPLSLVLADIDLLREVNNVHGHLAGDAMLVAVAGVFDRRRRAYDVPARFGGEEFVLLLPDTGPEEALVVADRIRRAVSELVVFAETTAEPIRATLSLGVASLPGDATTATDLIHSADVAVYRAKSLGRNRVVAAADLAEHAPSAAA